MENILLLDGLDIDDLDLSLTAIPGQFDSDDGTYDVTDIPDLDGVFLSSERPRIGARFMGADGVVVLDTMAELETTIQRLKDATAERLVQLTYAHALDRSYYGVRNGPIAGQLAHPGDDDGMAAVSMRFMCPDPYAIDHTPTTVTAAAGVRVQVPSGSGPTYPFIRVVGAATGPITITLRDHTGRVRAEMEFDVTLTADDALILSTVDGGDIWLFESGVLSDGADLVVPGYELPVILHNYADWLGGRYATLETSAGELLVTSYRRWR